MSFPVAAGSDRHSRAHSTYVNFSSHGDRIVCTYHGDHAYTFDVRTAASGAHPSVTILSGASPPNCVQNCVPPGQLASPPSQQKHKLPAWGIFPSPHLSLQQASFPPSTRSRSGSCSAVDGLPEQAEEARRQANRLMLDEDWSQAIEALTEAVRIAPWCAALYSRRAEALLDRVSQAC